MKSKIYIIIVNWNGAKDTIECLDSLQEVLFPKRFWTLVVDNGSTDDSVLKIRDAHPEIPIYESKTNLGFSGGNNLGIQWALQKKADWILLLNNDTLVSPDFLQAFLKASETKPQAKILGAKIYRYDDPKRIDHLGGFWNPKIAEFESLAQNILDDGTCFEEMEKVDYVCGAALFAHKSVFETIGLLEPNFFLFWEETDFCFRARRKGLEVWTAPKAKLWHKVSASFSGGKPHMHYFWWRSRLLFLKRNYPYEERRKLYSKVVLPELFKTLRHYLLRSLQNGISRILFRPIPLEKREKTKRLKAGLLGALHYSLSRFGNCPSSLSKK